MLRLRRITFFVDDVEAAARYYRDVVGLAPGDIREGWAGFKAGKEFEIAFHRGKGRAPRLEFVAGKLKAAREALNAKGARLGPVKSLLGRKICTGKDKDGNTIQLSGE
jgi:catechol 2,3-dioxygenase-like lactoylglutathione lyase family enzyme